MVTTKKIGGIVKASLPALALFLSSLAAQSCKDMNSDLMEDSDPASSDISQSNSNIKVFFDTPESSTGGVPLLVIKKPGSDSLTSLKIIGTWAFDGSSELIPLTFAPGTEDQQDKTSKVVNDRTTGDYYLLYMPYDMITEASKNLSANPSVKINNPRVIFKWEAVFGSEKKTFYLGDKAGLGIVPGDTESVVANNSVVDNKNPTPSATPSNTSTPSTQFAFDQTIANLRVSNPDSDAEDVSVVGKLGQAKKIIFELSAEWCPPCNALAREVAPELKDGMLGTCAVVTLMYNKRNSFKTRSPWSLLSGHIFEGGSNNLSKHYQMLTGQSGGDSFPTLIKVERKDQFGKEMGGSLQSMQAFCKE